MSASKPQLSALEAPLQTRSLDNWPYFLTAQLIVASIALYLVFAASWSAVSIESISRLLLLHLIWVLWSWRKAAGTLLNPYILFMLSATMFNAGLGLLEALHLSPQPVLADFSVETTTRSLVLVFAALSSLHFGALAALRHRPDGLGAPLESSPLNDRALRAVGSGLLAIAIVPLCIQLKDAVSIALSTGYLGLYQHDAPAAGLGSAIQTGADLVLPATCFLCAGNRDRPLQRRGALVVFMIYFGSLLYVGYRGGATMPMVTLAWLWDRTVARLPRSLLLVGGLILLVVFPLIRSTRELTATERKRVTVAKTYSELDTHPIVAAIEEMGGSVMTLAYTLEEVPTYHPYEMGEGYFYAALTPMPSLFWARHPSVTHGLPSQWLIETVDPATAKVAGGIGYTFIAEEFLNFGPFGVFLVSLLLGYGITRLWLWAERTGNAGAFVVMAAVLPFLLGYARGEAAYLPRPLIWDGVLPYWAYLFVRRRMEKNSSPTSPIG